jgi:hypothetical protein
MKHVCQRFVLLHSQQETGVEYCISPQFSTKCVAIDEYKLDNYYGGSRVLSLRQHMNHCMQTAIQLNDH